MRYQCDYLTIQNPRFYAVLMRLDAIVRKPHIFEFEFYGVSMRWLMDNDAVKNRFLVDKIDSDMECHFFFHQTDTTYRTWNEPIFIIFFDQKFEIYERFLRILKKQLTLFWVSYTDIPSLK